MVSIIEFSLYKQLILCNNLAWYTKLQQALINNFKKPPFLSSVAMYKIRGKIPQDGCETKEHF